MREYEELVSEAGATYLHNADSLEVELALTAAAYTAYSSGDLAEISRIKATYLQTKTWS